MGRYFTMRRRCKRCACSFIIASSNRWYCDNVSCVKARRKDDRARLKATRAPKVATGSDEHLGRALGSGE